jgi:hypothetical protein
MKARPAAKAEKLIDKNDIIGNAAVYQWSYPLAGTEVTKTGFMQLRS